MRKTRFIALTSLSLFIPTLIPTSLAWAGDRSLATNTSILVGQRSTEFDDAPTTPTPSHNPIAPPYPQQPGPNIIRPDFDSNNSDESSEIWHYKVYENLDSQEPFFAAPIRISNNSKTFLSSEFQIAQFDDLTIIKIDDINDQVTYAVIYDSSSREKLYVLMKYQGSTPSISKDKSKGKPAINIENLDLTEQRLISSHPFSGNPQYSEYVSDLNKFMKNKGVDHFDYVQESTLFKPTQVPSSQVPHPQGGGLTSGSGNSMVTQPKLKPQGTGLTTVGQQPNPNPRGGLTGGLSTKPKLPYTKIPPDYRGGLTSGPRGKLMQMGNKLNRFSGGTGQGVARFSQAASGGSVVGALNTAYTIGKGLAIASWALENPDKFQKCVSNFDCLPKLDPRPSLDDLALWKEAFQNFSLGKPNEIQGVTGARQPGTEKQCKVNLQVSAGTDNCLAFSKDCNESAADYLCKQAGHSGVAEYQTSPAQQTTTSVSGETCSKARGQTCHEFTSITCTASGSQCTTQDTSVCIPCKITRDKNGEVASCPDEYYMLYKPGLDSQAGRILSCECQHRQLIRGRQCSCPLGAGKCSVSNP